MANHDSLYGQAGATSLIGGGGSARDSYGRNSAFVSQDRLEKVKKNMTEIEEMLIETCRRLEESGQHREVFKDPKLKKWWEAHKAREIQKAEERRKAFVEALGIAKDLRHKLKHYLKYILDENIEDDDRSHFQKKIDDFNRQLQNLYNRYDGLEKKVQEDFSAKAEK